MKVKSLTRAYDGALLCAVLTACSSSLPAPPANPVPPDDMFKIPYPPPPDRAETIPPKKGEKDVWIDGQWDWNGKGWKWSDGAWATPPPGATYFTPWTTVRKPDGRLLFARATWRSAAGRPVPGGSGACGATPTSEPQPGGAETASASLAAPREGSAER